MGQVILAAVGDMSFGDHLLTLGDGVRSVIEREGVDHVFRHVRSHLDSADLAFGNFEGTITTAGLDPARPLTRTFRSGPEAAQALARAGFDVLNVANNHSLQYGAQGFADTLAALGEAGLDTIGTRGSTNEFLCAPLIKTVNGVRIGFLGYSQAQENFFAGEPLYATWDAQRVYADVRRLREQVDFLVVSCHWGIEQLDYAPPSVVADSRQLVEAGADVVLGHHSHVFQAVERYRNGLVLYGLGNFVFDTIWEEHTPYSAIAMIRLSGVGETREVSYELIPVRINARYQPEPLQGAARERFERRLREISERQPVMADRPLEELEQLAAQAEAKLHWRKIGFVLKRPHRVHADTWRVLVLDKLMRRLRPKSAAAAASR